MDYARVILNIFRSKCQHAPELRTFKILNSGLSFEKNRVQVLCQPEFLMEIYPSSAQNGPWTKLDDSEECDMYQAPIGLVLKQVKILSKFQILSTCST